VKASLHAMEKIKPNENGIDRTIIVFVKVKANFLNSKQIIEVSVRDQSAYPTKTDVKDYINDCILEVFSKNNVLSKIFDWER
jgi:hypothetical protein